MNVLHAMLSRLAGLGALSIALVAHASAAHRQVEIVPRDGSFADAFGTSVATDGARVLVGAPEVDDSGPASGSASLFDAATGGFLLDLRPGDAAPQDRFGAGVAIGADVAIVGAPRKIVDGKVAGAAYVFDAATGRQRWKLVPRNPSPAARFGEAVAVGDRFALIGAPQDSNLGPGSGAAHLFDGKTGHEVAKLVPRDPSPGARFGAAVAVRGSVAVIGAPRAPVQGIDSGSAYVFDLISGLQLARLSPSDGGSGDEFGSAVATDGTHVVVGARFRSPGVAYVFDASSGRQVARLMAPAGAPGVSLFGFSVAIQGTTAFVAERLDDVLGPSSGSVHVFDLRAGCHVSRLLASDGAAGDLFGTALAVRERCLVVGASAHDHDGSKSGAAYVIRSSSLLEPSRARSR